MYNLAVFPIMAGDINDNLIPLLCLPVIYADLFLLLFFAARFIPGKRRLNWWIRTAILLVVATVVFIAPGVYTWQAIAGNILNVLIAFPVLLVLNILFGIWHKK